LRTTLERARPLVRCTPRTEIVMWQILYFCVEQAHGHCALQVFCACTVRLIGTGAHFVCMVAGPGSALIFSNVLYCACATCNQIDVSFHVGMAIFRVWTPNANLLCMLVHNQSTLRVLTTLGKLSNLDCKVHLLSSGVVGFAL